MNRTERQKLGISKWIKCGGKGILEYGTGVGKTYCSLMLIDALYKRNPNLQVLIAVHTDTLKQQWTKEIIKWKFFSFCKIEIFNTIVKHNYNVDLFIIDELHLSCSDVFITMFEQVTYKYILGLTATLERLDGKHKKLDKYLVVCDRITLTEALENGWVSPYRNYKVLIKVDLSQYEEINRKFQSIFAVFGHDFKLVRSLVQNPTKVAIWSKKHGYEEKTIRGFLAAFMKLLKLRKSFVMSHFKKFEIANKILDYRSDKKCVIFSATVKDAEKFKNRALVLHSKKKKTENKKILEKFNNMSIGVISSPKSLNAGVDVKGLSVGIGITCDSSITTFTQKCGRICRLEDGKIAEMFTLIIANTIEETWYNNCNKGQTFMTINEQQLDLILKGQEISTRPKEGIIDIEHRF